MQVFVSILRENKTIMAELLLNKMTDVETGDVESEDSDLFEHESIEFGYRLETGCPETGRTSITFNCSVCHRRLSSKNALYLHFIRQHRKHEFIEFVCKICNAGCTTNWLLKQHINSTHYQIKYECGICPKLFAFKCSRNVHVKTMHKNSKFQPDCRIFCGYCKQVFQTVTGAEEHGDEMHAAQINGIETGAVSTGAGTGDQAVDMDTEVSNDAPILNAGRPDGDLETERVSEPDTLIDLNGINREMGN